MEDGRLDWTRDERELADRYDGAEILAELGRLGPIPETATTEGTRA